MRQLDAIVHDEVLERTFFLTMSSIATYAAMFVPIDLACRRFGEIEP